MSRGSSARPPRYHVLVLSLWEEEGRGAGDSRTWRFSLESPQIGGRKGFRSLTELAAYLAEWTQRPPNSPGPPAR